MTYNTPDARAFLEQNEIAAATLTVMEIAPYAEHHCGGLFVLGCPVGSDRYAKLHDSWGGEDTVVLHIYNPDFEFAGEGDDDFDPDETVQHFDTGREAFAAFLLAIGEES